MIRTTLRSARGPGPVQVGTPVARLVDAAACRGARTVLSGVTVEVVAGEVLALAGPNGAGKSTLLALLAGDVRPAAGAVELLGAPMGAWTAAELGMRRAVLLQTNPVAFPFSVEEVVRMGRAPWHGTAATRHDDDAAVERALDTVDLRALRHRPVPLLSGGEQARVALARTLAQDTSLILLDEPTAALDLPHAESALRHARSLADAGRAVVVVLHDLNAAAAHGDRVGLVAQGRLVACGAPAEVLTETTLSSVYGTDVEVLPHPRTGQMLIMSRR